jgi:hypothetical protein
MEHSLPEMTYLQNGRGVVTTRSQAIAMEAKMTKQKVNKTSDTPNTEDRTKSWKWFGERTRPVKKNESTESLF